jgi:diaminobutyrate-2-oxoglutarate transaminase
MRPADQTPSEQASERRFEDMHFEPAPALVGEVPGPRSREMLEEQERLESKARSYPRSVPIAIEEGRGATMRDVDGNTFIDFFGGAGVLNVGHSHPAALKAAAEQQQKLVHSLDFPTEPKLRLMRKLKQLLPGRLRESARFHFGGPTGSDAIEAALKLTRAHTGREAVVAFQGSYHGMTSGALSVTSDVGLGGPVTSSVHFMPYPYCYRCPLGLQPDSCEMACAKLLDTSLEDPHSGLPKPAAVIVEPIQGEGGTIVPPDGWLTELRRITVKHDVPLICDEIQTGFGRTGKMFAYEHDGIEPDVITLSKALGGIGYPISCIAYDERLDGWAPGAHIGTFRGHQVAMAAGLAAIEFMQEVDLAGHAAELGELTLGLLGEAQESLPCVGDVRGRGLMIGIELVKDRDSKEPWPEMARQIRTECFKRGVVIEVGGHFANVARFLPPLVISRKLLLTGVEIFIESVRAAEEALARPSALLTS